ncbi:hypothetical protein LTR10_008215 [Elasticomyces elasticus]|nr:hypothetical protein LTR10_008215 [Elasticomyces elasticus]KAK4967091.1 hypothetical protein LTR42_010439 [Elasticomyces elasticus]
MATVPIQSLAPNTAPPAEASIRGIVTLLWPYSSSTKSCALLVADPDFRLRKQRGQVRVRFHGEVAAAVARARLAIGDEVVLRLQGANWEQDVSTATTPGRNVGGELSFGRHLDLRIARAEGEIAVVVDAPAPQRSPVQAQRVVHATPVQRPSRAAHLDGPGPSMPIYSSPAFTKRMRLSGDFASDLDDDPFRSVTTGDEQPHKKLRLSFGDVGRWRFAARTPSPVKGLSRLADETEDDEQLPAGDGDLQLNGAGLRTDSAAEPSEELDAATNSVHQPELSSPSRASANEEDAMEVDEAPISDSAQPTQHSPISAPPGSMMPPPLPRLITTEASSALEEIPDSQGDASERSNGPMTPKLNAVPNSALPLPSPFPTEQAQQSFPLFGTGNVAQTSTVSTRGDNSSPERLGVLQHSPDIADEERVTPQSVPSHDAPKRQMGPSAEVSQVFDSERSNPELHVQDLVPSSAPDNNAPEEINDVTTDQTETPSLDFVSGGLTDAEPASSTGDIINKSTKEAELVQQIPLATQIDKHGSLQAEVGRQLPGPHTPAKEVPSKPIPFGINSTVQTTTPASQTTPQSQRDRVMARTYSSLFGFKRSPPPQPQFQKPPAATLVSTDRNSDSAARISQLDGADEMDVEEVVPPPMENTIDSSHDDQMSYSPPAASSLNFQAAASLAQMEDQAPSQTLPEEDIEVEIDHDTQLEASLHEHAVTDIPTSEIGHAPAEVGRPVNGGLGTQPDFVQSEVDSVASEPPSLALPALEVIELGSSSDVEELADNHGKNVDTASSPPQYAEYEPAHGAFVGVPRDDEDRHEPNADLLEPADDNIYEQNEMGPSHYPTRSGNVADAPASRRPDTIQISSDIDEDVHQYHSVETRHDEPLPAHGVTEASHVQHGVFQAQLDDLLSNPQTPTSEHGHIEEAGKSPHIVAITEIDDDLSSPPPTSQLNELEQEVQPQASTKQAPPPVFDDSERSSSPFPELIMPSKRKSTAPVGSQADTTPTGRTPGPLRVSTERIGSVSTERIGSVGVPAALRFPPDRVIEDGMDDGMSGTMSTQPTPIAEKFEIPDPPLQESVFSVPAEPQTLRLDVATVPAHEDAPPPEAEEVEIVEVPTQQASTRVISAQKRTDEPFLGPHESAIVSGEINIPSQDPKPRLGVQEAVDEPEISAIAQEGMRDLMAFPSLQPAASELAHMAPSTARTEVIELGSSSPAQEDFELVLDNDSSPVILSHPADLVPSEAPPAVDVLMQAPGSSPVNLLNDTRAFTPTELVASDEMGVMASPNRAQSAEPVPSEVSWQSQVRDDSDEDDSQAKIVPANQKVIFVAEPHASYSQGFETQVPLTTNGIFSYPNLPLSPLQSQPQPQSQSQSQSQHDRSIPEVQDEISELQQSERETAVANPAESYSQTFETQIPLAMNGIVSYESLPLSPLQSQPQHENNSSVVQQEMPIVQQGYQETPASDMPPTPQLTQHESDLAPVHSLPFSAPPALRMQLDGTEERDETVSTKLDEPLKATGYIMPAEVQDAPTIKQHHNAIVQAEMYEEQPSVTVDTNEAAVPPPSSREHIRSALPNNTPARKSLKSRLSGVPDVISTWFSSPKRQKGKATDAAREQHEDVAHPGRSISNGITTSLAYFTPLARLEEKLNSPTQEGPNNTVDVLVLVTDSTKVPERAKGGPRDYYTIFRVADLSQAENENVRVEVFRPWKATLPIANAGDVILLRAFSVKSRKREAYLLSTDASAWCVWRHGDAAASIANGSRPVWARKSLDGRADGMHEEIKGPPVELGDEERRHASVLREWWVSRRSTSSGLGRGDADMAVEGKISDVPVSKL